MEGGVESKGRDYKRKSMEIYNDEKGRVGRCIDENKRQLSHLEDESGHNGVNKVDKAKGR